MKKVIVIPGCISCGTCQAICSDVFEVTGSNPAKIKDTVDLIVLRKNEELIHEAAEMCPVSAIQIEE